MAVEEGWVVLAGRGMAPVAKDLDLVWAVAERVEAEQVAEPAAVVLVRPEAAVVVADRVCGNPSAALAQAAEELGPVVASVGEADRAAVLVEAVDQVVAELEEVEEQDPVAELELAAVRLEVPRGLHLENG